MPISSVGYPDFRRQQDYDSNPVFADARVISAPGAGGQVFGGYYVGNFAALAGVVQVQTNPITLRFSWSMDLTFAVIVGQRTMVIDPAILQPCYFHVASHGRFVQVEILNPGAFTGTISLWGSNRSVSNELTPHDVRLVQRNVVALGSGASDINWLSSYHSGRTSCLFATGGQPAAFQIQAEYAATLFTLVGSWIVAANANLTVEVGLPTTACQLVIINTGVAAANYTGDMTADTSGT